MNADARYENALDLMRKNETPTLTGRTEFESRIAFLPFHEKRLERAARERALASLSKAAREAEALAEIAWMNEIEVERRAELKSGDNPSGPIDRHAAGCSHDDQGFRIL